MLDFYLIRDDQTKPGYPEQAALELIGSLDSETFERLKKQKIISDRFDYYADFRWDTSLIKQIKTTIQQRKVQIDIDIKQLVSLLDVAEKNQSGLMAYGD